MNISGSDEYSSGCESGWTMYLDQHTNYSADQYNSNATGAGVYGGKVAFSGEDEDLSMVSDASSGPPHFHDVDECYVQSDYVCYSSAFELRKGKQKKKKSEEQRGGKNQSYYLDDTASSPTTNFPMENASLYNDRPSKEHVPGISETHFKGKSVLGKHFGFLKSSGKTASKKCDGVKGRNWQ
nr:GTP pyrophosphokinase [Ipomoea batatas]GMD91379.1 GTP pyrophosphokinase [Ipomoea batatas]